MFGGIGYSGYDTGDTAVLESQAANFFGFGRLGVAHVAPAVVSHGVEEQHRGSGSVLNMGRTAEGSNLESSNVSNHKQKT